MTLLAIALYVATACLLVALFAWVVPALHREWFRSRMVQLALRLEDHIDRGELSHHRYVESLRHLTYGAAVHPEWARLREAVWFARHPVGESPTAFSREAFRKVVSPAEYYIADQIRMEFNLLIIKQALRGSPFWLIFWLLGPVIERMARRSAGPVVKVQQGLTRSFAY